MWLELLQSKASLEEIVPEKRICKCLMNSLSGFSSEFASNPNKHELMTSSVKEPKSL